MNKRVSQNCEMWIWEIKDTNWMRMKTHHQYLHQKWHKFWQSLQMLRSSFKPSEKPEPCHNVIVIISIVIVIVIKVLPNLWERQLPLHQLEQRKRYGGLLLHQVFFFLCFLHSKLKSQNLKHKTWHTNTKHETHQLEQRYLGLPLNQVFFFFSYLNDEDTRSFCHANPKLEKKEDVCVFFLF